MAVESSVPVADAGPGAPAVVEFRAGDAFVAIDDPDLVFGGTYGRTGSDLTITGPQGNSVTIPDFFAAAHPPALMAGGATLSGDAVSTLAGPAYPGQYAQAGAGPALAAIGKVQTQTGAATATRADGTTVSLQVDDPVYQGDVIQTTQGASVSISLADGSIFALSQNARMIMDEMVYDPNGSSNSLLFNFVQGTFSFIAGKVAGTGNMAIETPVATMGIRGTTVVANVEAVSGVSRFSLVEDPDGSVGAIQIISKQTGLVIGSITTTTVSLVVETISSAPVEIARDVSGEQSAVQLIYDAFADQQRRGELDLTDPSRRIQQASADSTSSGLSDIIDPGNPLQTLQNASVGDIVPLGTLQQLAALTTGSGTLSDGTTPTGSTGGSTNGGLLGPSIPVLSLPSTVPNVAEDGSVTITGFGLSTGSNAPLTVTIVAQSTVTLASTAGLTFQTGDGVDDETMVFTGSPSDVLAALDGLTYIPTPDNDGGGGIAIVIDDGNFIVAGTLNVSITPVPDAPVAVDDTFATVEGVVISGNVLADNGGGADFDPDSGDTFSVVAVAGSGEGVGVPVTTESGAIVTMQADGSYTYVPPESVAGGATFTDTFTYTIADSTGRTGVGTATVVVTGVNDGATIAGTATGDVVEDTTLTATGTLTVTDPDTGESGLQAVPAGTPGANGYGTFAVTSAGVWTYTLGNADLAVQALGAGEQLTDSIEVASLDGTATQLIAVTITGANDGIEIGVADLSGAVTEDSDEVVQLTDSGTIAFSDVDLNDIHEVTVAPAGETEPQLGIFTAEITGSATGDGAGEVTWSFTVDNDDVQFLGAGETITETYSVTLDDGSGSTVSRDVAVTLTGVNDGIVIVDGDLSGAVGEESNEGGPLTDSGTISFTDVDLSDQHDVTAAFAGSTHDGQLGSLTAAISDAATGDGAGEVTWTYQVDNQQLQHLGEDDVVTETFTVTIDDGNGSAVSRDVSVTLTGVNDRPLISDGGDETGVVVEDGDTSATGLLVASDADAGAVLAWTLDSATNPGAAADEIGGVDYRFAIDRLVVEKSGEVIFTDEFDGAAPPPSGPNGATTYSTNDTFDLSDGRAVMDGSAAGPNQSALFSSVPSLGHTALLRSGADPSGAQTLSSGTDFAVTGRFDLVIPDEAREFYGIRLTDRVGDGANAPPQPGDDVIELVIRLNGSGNPQVILRERDFSDGVVTPIQTIALDFDLSQASQIDLRLEHSAANNGEVTASFTLLDAAGQPLQGVNGSPLTFTFTQTAQIFGTETPNDPTDDELFTRPQIVAASPGEVLGSSIAGAYGTLSIAPSGEWTYDLDNGSPAVQSLAEGQIATDSFTAIVADEAGASDSRDITITVTGQNDAPELADATTLAFEDGGSVTVDLSELGSDIDSDDDGATLVYRIANGPSEGSVAIDGTVLTFDPGTNFQDLAQGETRTVSVGVQAIDRHDAASTSAQMTFTITGVNDAPTVSVSAPAGFLEASDAEHQMLFDSGTVTFADVDASDLVTITYASNGISWSGGELDPTLAQTLVTGFSTGTDGAMAPGTIGWTYAAAADLDFLGEGQTITFSYTVTATDSQDATATDTVNFTITGTDEVYAGVYVTFVSETAAFQNTFGWYDSQTMSGGVVFGAVEQDLLGGAAGTAMFTISPEQLDTIGYFLIPDGGSFNTMPSGAVQVTVEEGTSVVSPVGGDAFIGRFGEGTTAGALFTDPAISFYGEDHAASAPLGLGGSLDGDTADGPLGGIAWEDIAPLSGSDLDYDDAVFDVRAVLRGGGADDAIVLSDLRVADLEAGRLQVDGAGGEDTLLLDAGVDLDLTQISNLQIQNVERIDLGAPDANTLTVGYQDVFDMSANHELVVSGEASDSVFLVADADGAWQTSEPGADGYTRYDFVGVSGVLASVAIDSDVSVNPPGTTT